MTNVVRFTGISRLDLNPETVINSSLEAGLSGVVIIGYDSDGEEYFASSYADGGDVLWLLERMKMSLLKIVD